MNHKFLKPRQALNKAFLKVKPVRTQIEVFKDHLVRLLDQINEKESEEFHKNLVSDFLKRTYYEPDFSINTKGRNDMVIHTGKDAKSPVGVILETKKPTNRAEMLSLSSEAKAIKSLNVKSFQELILYFLRERITHNNLEVKHLVVTNIYEWFIFDAAVFEKAFAQNKTLVKDFKAFEEGRLSGNTTDFFYKEIAAREIDKLEGELPFTYFDLRNYDKPLRNADKKDDVKLIALFKLLSPEHLLKLPFTNDSNSLDRRFYSELLHIIGLSETKEGGKKLIGRSKVGERNAGSILENAIIELDSLDKISRLQKPSHYGDTHDERLFNVALELSITWINRILFLKLLEAQLLTYHKGDKSFAFLNLDKIKNYDDLNSLFFKVLAKKHADRSEEVKKIFGNVPYLNSSLFEPTDMEHDTLFISNLRDEKAIPIISSTVLKNEQGKKRTGTLSTLEYLFEFLNAYDFSSEGSEDIQEDNKTLINASVLGLIFEKINGYKDGSIFTPGFITMYMCGTTIRKAVVQKFNEAKGWNCQSFEELKEDIQEEIRSGNRKEVRRIANQIINSLKIVDPAVGSGHFLVSALNELIAIKSELKILVDANLEPISSHTVEVVNDELVIVDLEGNLFEYNYLNKDSQRIQETLFLEKQTIIENCLFGVDINPNSVKICRLRLWIELLKNAYYKQDLPGFENQTGLKTLETLPNIDINIKCGNSLVSRFAIDSDLSEALRKSKYSIDSYRLAVMTYRNAQSKEEKREMERLIAEIKSDFRSEIAKNDPKIKRKAKLGGELYNLTMQTGLFSESAKEKKDRKKKIEKIEEELSKLTSEIEEIKDNKIYENAFEWRFEFPEVLNEIGDFVGFDVVIGNPPYINLTSRKVESKSLEKLEFKSFDKNGDLYNLFCELGNSLLKTDGFLNFIIPNKWLNASYGKSLRNYLIEYSNPLIIIDFEKVLVFDEAIVFVCILLLEKKKFVNKLMGVKILSGGEIQKALYNFNEEAIKLTLARDENWSIQNKTSRDIYQKINNKGTELKYWEGINFYRGVTTGFNNAFHITEEERREIVKNDPNSSRLIYPLLRGKDIKRYRIDNPNLYLIFTKRDQITLEEYPGIQNHLSKFKNQLTPKQKESDLEGRKPGNYKWFEIQDNTAYSDEFSKNKLIWIEISDKANFTFDNSGSFLTNSAYFISGNNLKYLLAILNSKLCDYYFFQNTAKIAGGRKRYTKQYVEQNPIPIIPKNEQKPFETLVDKILEIKEKNPLADTSNLEKEIDQLVYELYGLTEEEIKIVEGGEN